MSPSLSMSPIATPLSVAGVADAGGFCNVYERSVALLLKESIRGGCIGFAWWREPDVEDVECGIVIIIEHGNAAADDFG